MGILDRASRGFSRSLDETVRVVDYDAIEPEEEAPQKKVKAPKEPKAPRVPKPKKERKKIDFSAAKNLLPEKKAKPEPEEEFEEEEPEEKPFNTKFTPIDTAFEIDDEEPNYYEEKQMQWEEKASVDPETEALNAEVAIQDVLDVLKIPATFEIKHGILMPDDFSEIDFDIQVPQGYDVGQVQFFVEKTEASVQEYLNLLELRNKHIAKLATTIDRLQVDANNLKYDSEIAAGIGIMPTSDSIELENENMELKLQIQKLKDSNRTTMNSEERTMYEEMRNEVARLQRENADLNEANYELRTTVAKLEEDADEMDVSASTEVEHEAAEIVFQSMDDEALPDFMAGLPTIEELPSPDITPNPSQSTVKNSNFEIDDDDLPFTTNQTEDSNPVSFQDDDDDDDELDQLMREWKNE